MGISKAAAIEKAIDTKLANTGQVTLNTHQTNFLLRQYSPIATATRNAVAERLLGKGETQMWVTFDRWAEVDQAVFANGKVQTENIWDLINNPDSRTDAFLPDAAERAQQKNKQLPKQLEPLLEQAIKERRERLIYEGNIREAAFWRRGAMMRDLRNPRAVL